MPGLAWGTILSFWVLRAAAVGAHALDPVLFELLERADGKVDVTWKAPNTRALGLDLVPVLPSQCVREGDVATELDEDASISRWVVDCRGSIVGATVGITGLESTDALLRVTLRSGAVDRHVLGMDRPTATISAQPSRGDVLRDYAGLGIEHIAAGADHLLFVFGLLLLSNRLRPLLATVSAFTLGHSATLALAALEIVSVPQAPVEVVIALTIWILAVELSRDVPKPTAWLRRWPWAMAFSFGLLHGLGFAGALRETGLPATDIPLALLSFNLGIEVGQVAFVVPILLAAQAWRRMFGSPPAWMWQAPVYAMGTASTYWILARATLLW